MELGQGQMQGYPKNIDAYFVVMCEVYDHDWKYTVMTESIRPKPYNFQLKPYAFQDHTFSWPYTMICDQNMISTPR